VALVLSAGSAAASCTLVSGLDGYTGGVTSPNDGAPADTSVEDVARPPAFGDAGACDGGHAFCDDFDTETFPDLTRWTEFESTPPASLSRSDDALSGPYALLAASPDAGFNAVAGLRKAFDGGVQSIRCSFALNVESLTTPVNDPVWLVVLALTPAQGTGFSSYYVGLRVIGDGRMFVTVTGERTDGGATVSDGMSGMLPFGRWVRMAFELKPGDPSQILWSMDGAPVASRLVEGPSAHDVEWLDLGVLSSPLGAATRVLYDDIMCDRQ
jgi:hypothetical protein